MKKNTEAAMMKNEDLPNSRGAGSGQFEIGCNYWASHAGTQMWSRWDEGVVRRDFKALAGLGLTMVRVFPLWPVFQPLELHRTYQGAARELQIHGHPLSPGERERAGVSEEAMGHFQSLADIAQSHGIRLVVGLITGWMSGEIYAPPAFAGLNLLTDPLAVKWQIKFVHYFVKTFRKHPAIAYWEPGNECNCMGAVGSREEAWHWVNALTSAIRAEDPSRPVASGMHGIWPGSECEFDPYRKNYWTIQEQGGLVDLMTSHPYPHSPSKKPARVDPIGSLRSHFQAVVESRLYSDLGGKPCLVEELGTFGPMFCDEQTKALFLQTVLWNCWAHDARGLLWWCGFDQGDLRQSPYDWIAWERELGLFQKDHQTPKPVALTMAKFGQFLKGLPEPALPPFSKQAVCLLGRGLEGHEVLEIAWSAFLLAKQAGFDLVFSSVSDPLPESSLYLLPGLREADGIGRGEWHHLLDKVSKGATLYVSIDNASLSPFTEPFGLKVRAREERVGPMEFTFQGATFRSASPIRLRVETTGAEILASEGDGNPVFTRHRYGTGVVYSLAAPIEKNLGVTHGGFQGKKAIPFYRFYQNFGAKALSGRLIRHGNPEVSATEHFLDEARARVVLINHSEAAVDLPLGLRPGWAIRASFPEQKIIDYRIAIPSSAGVLLQLAKQKTEILGPG